MGPIDGSADEIIGSSPDFRQFKNVDDIKRAVGDQKAAEGMSVAPPEHCIVCRIGPSYGLRAWLVPAWQAVCSAIGTTIPKERSARSNVPRNAVGGLNLTTPLRARDFSSPHQSHSTLILRADFPGPWPRIRVCMEQQASSARGVETKLNGDLGCNDAPSLEPMRNFRHRGLAPSVQ